MRGSLWGRQASSVHGAFPSGTHALGAAHPTAGRHETSCSSSGNTRSPSPFSDCQRGQAGPLTTSTCETHLRLHMYNASLWVAGSGVRLSVPSATSLGQNILENSRSEATKKSMCLVGRAKARVADREGEFTEQTPDKALTSKIHKESSK